MAKKRGRSSLVDQGDRQRELDAAERYRPPAKTTTKPQPKPKPKPVKAKKKTAASAVEDAVDGGVDDAADVVDHEGTALGKIAEKYTGRNFPATATGVRNFMVDAGAIGKASELGQREAQLIANRFHAIPAANAVNSIKEIAHGLKSTVQNAEGGNAISAILNFFEIGETGGEVASAVGRAGRSAWRGLNSAGSNPLVAGGALALASSVRGYRENVERNKELDLQEKQQPTAQDIFNGQLMQELKMRSEARLQGGGQGLSDMLTDGQASSPFTSASLPPSSGYPTG